jgi:hypothetical protein
MSNFFVVGLDTGTGNTALAAGEYPITRWHTGYGGIDTTDNLLDHIDCHAIEKRHGHGD